MKNAFFIVACIVMSEPNIVNGLEIKNDSISTKKKAYFTPFHEISKNLPISRNFSHCESGDSLLIHNKKHY